MLLVTYNRPDLLKHLLNAVQHFNWNYTDFVIVDNASDPATQLILEECKSILNLTIVSLAENIGHGAGLASGLDQLKELNTELDYVVFLEDDSIPKANYLSFLLAKIQDTRYSMISSAGSLVSLGKRRALKPTDSEILTADFALFDGAIARFQDLLKVGFPVRDWFMMFDDFEYCYRIRKEGFNIGVVANPHLEILHEGWGGGVSHSHLWRSYYQSRNYILFVRLHFTWWNFFDCLILQNKRLIGGLISGATWNLTRMRVLGIGDGLKNFKGKSLNPKTLKRNLLK
ncbi:GT2 family glycosyltransferase [Algoriphagus antarcticus]|uniref:GT2 family glycosyltransferase n=1 Tax=Algoriphagus antarcticus TaxID=238540 RepID=A0A3E0DZN2_9BACT|nr:GT2 family glycosyltransferase [Algoriphagus antarcticus]